MITFGDYRCKADGPRWDETQKGKQTLAETNIFASFKLALQKGQHQTSGTFTCQSLGTSCNPIGRYDVSKGSFRVNSASIQTRLNRDRAAPDLH